MTNYTIGAVSTILHMLKRWRHKAQGGASTTTPSDVPAGHVAVYVGTTRKRYVLRVTQLNHPVLKSVLAEAEEEFGFPADGPLLIPCNESMFEEILVGMWDPQRSSHVGMRGISSSFKKEGIRIHFMSVEVLPSL